MHLINTDGLALIGPGSEWFWTAVSGIILAVTFVAIYRQLRLGRDAEANKMIETFDAGFHSERMSRHKLAAMRWLAAGGSVPTGNVAAVGNFWESLGTLGRRGHLDTRLLWDAFGNDCLVWWLGLEDWIRGKRAEIGDPKIFEHFEWLAQQMVDLDRRGGSEPITAAWAEASLPSRIAATEDQIRIDVALRSPDPALGSAAVTA